MSVGYSAQARLRLTRALQAEVDDGSLTERRAIAYATRVMRTNQEVASTSRVRARPSAGAGDRAVA